MKSNVDLTQDRTFRTPQFVLPDVLWAQKTKSMPWHTLRVADDELLYEPDEPVFTGNAEDRQRKRTIRKLDSGEICECCGKDVSWRPWGRIFGLCLRCEDLYATPREFPWTQTQT